MRVCVIHNLSRGGARRRLGEHLSRLDADLVELCPASATPILDDALRFRLPMVAPKVPRPLRVPLRYIDLGALLMTWQAIRRRIVSLAPDVVYANPCRYLQAPAALLGELPPTLYFCDEPRRVDSEPAAKASRNDLSRGIYGPMYAAQRRADQRATRRATQLATNSRYTAGRIRAVYEREAEVVPMGVMDACLTVGPGVPSYVLSVGSLIPSKRHDLAIDAAARSRGRWPVVVVAPASNPTEEDRLRAIADHEGVALEIRIGITDEYLARTYADAQVTVYMAEREPFGLASLEAQAAGCPVIVASDGGLPETIVEQRSGWVAPRSASAVAEHIDRLDRDDLRRTMSRCARTWASDRGWAKSADHIESMLRALAR
jgi:glycosyltransferase involved in cell wall biosynthesis